MKYFLCNLFGHLYRNSEIIGARTDFSFIEIESICDRCGLKLTEELSTQSLNLTQHKEEGR